MNEEREYYVNVEPVMSGWFANVRSAPSGQGGWMFRPHVVHWCGPFCKTQQEAAETGRKWMGIHGIAYYFGPVMSGQAGDLQNNAVKSG